jgi:hypothetical protein
LSDVPYLLPTVSIDGVDAAIRAEWASPPGDRPSYHQIWVSDADDAVFEVVTRPDRLPFTSPEEGEAVEIEGWDQAYLGPAGPGYAYLTLVAGDGHVLLSGQNLGDEQLVAAARTMTRRADGEPGWEIVPAGEGPVAVHEGWTQRYVSRETDWYDGNRLAAEITIIHGLPDQMTDGTRPGGNGDLTVVDIDGTPALVVQRPYGDDPLTTVSWTPGPDLVVYYGVVAARDHALTIVRSIQPVDRATWESVSQPADPRRDGCQSFLC